MKKLLLFLLLIPTLCFGQYPIIDDYNSAGGAGEWYNSSGGADMCVESGTLLCYNCTGNYSNWSWYDWRSPDYGTQFVDDMCDSITISFTVNYDIRNNDGLYFGANDGGWLYYRFDVNGGPASSTLSGTFQSTITQFSLGLYSRNGGSRDNQYVHYDSFTIGCISSSPLPITLISFDCNVGDNINLFWSTQSENNNDYFTVEHSTDGYIWDEIGVVDGAGYSNQRLDYNLTHYNPPYVINYYKLSQFDFNGNYEVFDIISCFRETTDKDIKYVLYYNAIGQEIEKPLLGYYIKITTYIDDTQKISRIHLISE